MLKDKKLLPAQAFEIADAIQAAAAAALLLRRSLKSGLTDQQYDALVARETALRYDADRYRAVGITLLACNGEITTQGLVDAIDQATAAINAIHDVSRILNILSKIATLGITIASGNAQAILSQMSELKGVVKANTAV
ncbi:hypothetical protein [Gallionella capsiferriformans]|jgi:hypothetical protein|uniref:Uncharacterized protein n=1 Tax=Gallionella capsiferriformans (strain ES-2) TaxID=395494 RepID=D9SGP7_GALCS|nr:hypothetical protein [Gallionella capsiferriformans]ADL55693.1 hypothetical protein Galf_1681 [Gallionella capsiferriformans ES-2]